MMNSIRVTPLREDSVSSVYVLGDYYSVPLPDDALEVIEKKEELGGIEYLNTLEEMSKVFLDPYVMGAYRRDVQRQTQNRREEEVVGRVTQPTVVEENQEQEEEHSDNCGLDQGGLSGDEDQQYRITGIGQNRLSNASETKTSYNMHFNSGPT